MTVLIACYVLAKNTISAIAEAIEFAIIKLVSGRSFEELQADQIDYFIVRNQNWILILKILYSLISGIVGGYLVARISKKLAKTAIYILILLQAISLIWGGFFSNLSATGPFWMWLYLIIIIPEGIWIGYKWRSKNVMKNSN